MSCHLLRCVYVREDRVYPRMDERQRACSLSVSSELVAVQNCRLAAFGWAARGEQDFLQNPVPRPASHGEGAVLFNSNE